MIRLSKKEYLAYRNAARELLNGPPGEFKQIVVPSHAPVQAVEGGAFVEAIIFVPKEKLRCS